MSESETNKENTPDETIVEAVAEAVVVEEAAAVEPIQEPVVEAVPETKPKAKPSPAAVHVVGGGDVDDVYLKQCVFKNPYARKSLTVHHLQRRLVELGYADAGADRDGWYGDLTKLSVEAWQKDNRIEPTGVVNAKTLEGVFAGDPNVRVNI